MVNETQKKCDEYAKLFVDEFGKTVKGINGLKFRKVNNFNGRGCVSHAKKHGARVQCVFYHDVHFDKYYLRFDCGIVKQYTTTTTGHSIYFPEEKILECVVKMVEMIINDEDTVE